MSGAKNKATQSDRPTLIGLVPAQHRLPAVFLLVSEAIFTCAMLRFTDPHVQIALVAGSVFVLVAFLVRVFSTRTDGATTRTPMTVVKSRLDTGQIYDPIAEKEYDIAREMKDAGAFEEALVHYRKTVALQPNHWKAHYNIGTCLLAQEKYDSAIQKYKELTAELSSKDSTSDAVVRIRSSCLQQIAVALDATEHTAQAYEYLKQALAIDPSFDLIHLNLLVTAAKLGLDNEARGWYNTVRLSIESGELLRMIPREEVQHLRKYPWFRERSRDGHGPDNPS